MAEIAHKIISPINVEERRNLDIRPGDTVRVSQKIQDKGKTRLQIFEGIILARKHGKEAGGTFTVRRSTGGVAVEKIYPLYSPMIDKIEVVKRAKVRRSKLYYIREKAAKQIRRQMRRSRFMDIATESDIEAKARVEAEAKEAEEKAAEQPEEVVEDVVETTPTEETKTEEKKEETPTEEAVDLSAQAGEKKEE